MATPSCIDSWHRWTNRLHRLCNESYVMQAVIDYDGPNTLCVAKPRKQSHTPQIWSQQACSQQLSPITSPTPHGSNITARRKSNIDLITVITVAYYRHTLKQNRLLAVSTSCLYSLSPNTRLTAHNPGHRPCLKIGFQGETGSSSYSAPLVCVAKIGRLKPPLDASSHLQLLYTFQHVFHWFIHRTY